MPPANTPPPRIIEKIHPLEDQPDNARAETAPELLSVEEPVLDQPSGLERQSRRTGMIGAKASAGAEGSAGALDFPAECEQPLPTAVHLCL